ncbi:DUF4011 domain-containing protein [Nitrospira defluvii]|nr:DUF4011 domain-containing protein [Nitrospira defluvii]
MSNNSDNNNPAMKALENLRMRLLDLSARNRLLNFRHTKGALRIIDELPNQLSASLLAETEMRFLPVPEPRIEELIEAGYIKIDPETGNEQRLKKDPNAKEWAHYLGLQTSYEVPLQTFENDAMVRHNDRDIQTLLFPYEQETRLRNLYQKSESAIKETGANVLYLSLGFLEWFESRDSDKTRISPLFLIPARMHKGRINPANGTYEYTLSYSGEDIMPNLSLREKLRVDFGLVLPDFNESALPESYLNDVASLIEKHHPRWGIRRFITLALLNFSKLLMYLDLNPKRWPEEQAITEHPIVKRFLSTENEAENEDEDKPLAFCEEYLIDDIPEIHKNYPLITDADSSQHSALVDAIDGKNLVIEGPPGTGKSQTITNLIAAAMARGKKVLFVAEKLAALEVVKRNLDKANMGEFCLELHSHKSQKRKVLDEIETRLDKKARYRSPKDIEADIARFESLKTNLKQHVELINRLWKNTGKTCHEILMTATRYREALQIDPSLFHPEKCNGQVFGPGIQRQSRDQVLAFSHVYKSVAQELDEGDGIQAHPWFGVRKGDLQFFDREKVCVALASWQQSIQSLLDLCPAIIKVLTCDAEEIPNALEGLEGLKLNLLMLPELQGDEVLSALPNIKGGRLQEFSECLKLFDEIQALNQRLSKTVCREVLDDLNLVNGLLDKCEQLRGLVRDDTDLITLSESFRQIEQLENHLQVFQEPLDKITSELGDVVGHFLRVHEDGLKEFKTFVELVASLKSGHWKYRNDCFDNDELDPLLPNLKRKLDALRNTENTLAEKYDMNRVFDMGELEDIQYTLTDDSVFRWFKSEWRLARKQFFNFGASKKIKFKDLWDSFDTLIKFSREKKKLEEDPDSKTLLGEHFVGYDTDIDMIVDLRTWYQKIRESYGVGFGPKVGIGNAIITMPSDLGRSIRSLAERDTTIRIDTCLDELSYLKSVFSAVEALQAGNVDLLGSEGVTSSICAELQVALEPCKAIMQDKTISLSALTQEISTLDLLKDKIERWKATGFDRRVFGDQLKLVPKVGVNNEPALESARHTESLALVINNTCSLIQNVIYKKTDAEVFQSLKEIGNRLREALDQNENTQSKFSSIVGLNLEDWKIHCGENLEKLIKRNKRALDNPSPLINWLSYVPVREHLSAMGFECLALAVEKKVLSIENIEAGLLTGVYDLLSREVFSETPELARFSGRNQEALQKQFRDYDERLKTLQREKIAWLIDQRDVPMGNYGGRVSEYTNMSLLEHECGKKKRHIPIRQLVRRAGKALVALKPCFMMSPMSVAQYLAPGQLEFDLVVMDEASQIKPVDALGALARGGQLVVVGDPKQLPPSNFFDRVIDEEEEDPTAIEESESILDATASMFPLRRLRWHYRSRHESLIAFSNYHFYKSDLVVFPSPHNNSADYGIQFLKINGRFVNRRNIEEAKIIAEAIREHFKNHPDETLGIVTMNAEQKEQIERSVEEMAKEDTLEGTIFREQLEKDQSRQEFLFIKNLENVQGDERDVIFISMTYGPQEIGGRVMQRFGPINSDVGWRRLNVLFTRSKKRMHIFSSMSADDIVVSGTSKRGVQVFKDFLAYLETGLLSRTGIDNDRGPDSDFEIAVMDALRCEGFECQPQVGVAGYFIDIGVIDPGKPGRYLMGIECDGASYHSAKSVRDRDRLRESHLVALGWCIRRIWSTDWFKNPQAELKPLIRELHELKTVWPEEGEVLSEAEEINEIIEQVEKEEEPIDLFISEELDLEQKLINFDKEVIRKEQPDTPENQRLLRPAMMDAFLEYCPTSKWEFLENIPSYLRGEIAPSEGKYLKVVFEIINDTVDEI